MFRFLFRFAGLWVLAAGFIALVYDGTKSIAGNQLFFTSLSQRWTEIHAGSLQAMQDWITPRADWLWQYAAQPVLEAPAWIVLGLAGAILMIIGRKKKPLIGYGRD